MSHYTDFDFRVLNGYIKPKHRELFVFFEDEEPFPDKLERAHVLREYERPDLEAVVYKNVCCYYEDYEHWVAYYVFNDGSPYTPAVIGRNLKRTYTLAQLTFSKTNY